MAENRTAVNVKIILVASALMALFTYIFVDHHLETPERVNQDRSTLLSTSSSVPEAR